MHAPVHKALWHALTHTCSHLPLADAGLSIGAPLSWRTCSGSAWAVRGSAEYTWRRACSLSSVLGIMWCDALQASSCVTILIAPHAAATCVWPGWRQHACYGPHNVQCGRNTCNVILKQNLQVHAPFMWSLRQAACWEAAGSAGLPVFHRRKLFSATGRMRWRSSVSRRASTSGASLDTWHCLLTLTYTRCLNAANGHARQHAGAVSCRDAYHSVPGVQVIIAKIVSRVSIDQALDSWLGCYPC